ncbi:alpha/beta hydrolase [Amycolatopsis taiwanensis]|uniref:Carboxylesterase n=1 Tax=Amycolatopsis taiwanensis TaxID=342230 RepID=A0A9W6R968_9PSEU|nr:alpha/beta fold hydrolase [Amycolatopsis taiwanensis]GLY69857.1 carboxylesterase [Amycolatopsis taiwanensis]
MLAGAEPFSHSGTGEVAVLLCHGFTSTPQSMRSWAEYLAARDFTVRAPLLPGHGTTWQELNRTRWPDWYLAVREELLSLRETCSRVFVCGQSMGGTLALRLAEEFGEQIAGLVLVNPSVMTQRWDAKLLPLLSRVLPSVPGIGSDIAKPGSTELAYRRLPVRATASLAQLWRVVRADLPKVTQPILLLHSRVDHVVEPVNSRIVRDSVRSERVVEVLLENSFHVATLDNDAPLIFERSVEFVQEVG